MDSPADAPVPCAYRFGPFEVDLRKIELRRDGIRLRLERKPWQLLLALLERPGELVTRAELERRLWGEGVFVDFEHGVNVAVKKVRQALCDSAGQPRYIETVAGLGYRFLAPIESVVRAEKPSSDSGTVGTLPMQASAAAEVMSTWRRRRFVAGTTSWVFLASAVILAAYFGYFRHVSTASKPPRKIMLAVLPFENLSGDSEQEYFSEGLTEEMIARLGGLQPQRLGVIARTSAMRYKNSDLSVDRIGRELGVDYVLEGSVRRAENRVRITAELIQVSDQTHLWTQNYDREVADILKVQAEVTQQVAQALVLELLPARRGDITGAHRLNPEAHEAYLKGRYFLNKRTQQDFRKAKQYFEQSIENDPDNGPAYSGLADVYILLAEYGWLPANESYAVARGAAVRALQIHEGSAEAHTSLASVRQSYDWDWPGAEAEYKRALELNPNYATAHQWYAEFLSDMGRNEEALAESKRALELDPLSLVINGVYGDLLCKLDHSADQLRKTVELDPGFRPVRHWLADCYQQKGMYTEAAAELEEATRLSGAAWNTKTRLAAAYSALGREQEALKMAHELERASRQGHVPAYGMAVLWADLGEKEQALKWLERAYQERSSRLLQLNEEPRLKPLRSDARFQAVVRRMNLPTTDR